MTFTRRTVFGFGLSLLAPVVGPFAARAQMDGANAMDAATQAALKAALASPDRDADNKARDRYRHPLDELEFFGLRRGMTVMEIWPGGGWWTEFLAPVVVGAGGTYIAAVPSAGADGADALKTMMKQDPEHYGAIKFASFEKGKLTNVRPNSVDLVITFRNIHNWMLEGVAKQMFEAMDRALKPGGHLGVEEHRGPADKPQDPKAESGYVRQDYAIDLIKSAGFGFEAASEVNANPKDTKDYPKGVWTLPPTYLEGDKDHAKYAAIGESDRFTLLFQKPAA